MKRTVALLSIVVGVLFIALGLDFAVSALVSWLTGIGYWKVFGGIFAVSYATQHPNLGKKK